MKVPESLPDTDLLATRLAVEGWLMEHAEYWDDDRELAANNLTLWARAFLRLTERDAREAGDSLRREGASEFVERVTASAASVARGYGMDETTAVARAFAAEAGWMRGEGRAK